MVGDLALPLILGDRGCKPVWSVKMARAVDPVMRSEERRGSLPGKRTISPLIR